MRITLKKRGGIGGGVGPSPSVDSDALSADEEAALRLLVAAAKAEPTLQRRGLMREEIVIEDADGATVLDQPVTDMTAPFTALRNWLTQRARSTGGAGRADKADKP